MSDDKDKNHLLGAEYGLLIIKELERLSEGQENFRKDFDTKFKEVNDALNDMKGDVNYVKDIKDWKSKIDEIWSPTQMKEVKDEVYEQKTKWTKFLGIIIAVQVLVGILITFKDSIFN